MEKKCCVLCFFYRIDDHGDGVCTVKKKRFIHKLGDKYVEVWQLAERCQSFREDASFSRLGYPIGVTPEEQEKARRADILAALKEE